MVNSAPRVFDELVRAGALLSREFDFKTLLVTLVDQCVDVSGSDLGAVYLAADPEKRRCDVTLSSKRGAFDIPSLLSPDDETIDFLWDCGESVVANSAAGSPFRTLFLHPSMQSAIALPLATAKAFIGIIILNSKETDHYNSSRFNFLNAYASLASGMLHNSKMYKELREYLNKIESMEQYQENVFSSMTNLLITTEKNGRIRYFNREAAELFELTDQSVGQPVNEFLKKRMDKKILGVVETALGDGEEVLGLEGIYRSNTGEVDFSLNVSPIGAKRALHNGLTLLFTNQTKERELKDKVHQVTEERRLIKDMFSRYLSTEVVQHLIDSPGIVGLGGSDKKATVFFADIRGYTSFSEGRDPQFIIKVLNEYFTEAVEIVIKYRGFIDKFIGDCIMAAWGVPMVSEQEDAINAVSCALEIQQLIASGKRTFFKGEAEKLRVGFGMHTGHLVAGNLGSLRKMNYSIIGDTVNIAARLEGVAAAGEIIITQETKDLLDDMFILDKRKPVLVKGKAKEIIIYNVRGKR